MWCNFNWDVQLGDNNDGNIYRNDLAEQVKVEEKTDDDNANNNSDDDEENDSDEIEGNNNLKPTPSRAIIRQPAQIMLIDRPIHTALTIQLAHITQHIELSHHILYFHKQTTDCDDLHDESITAHNLIYQRWSLNLGDYAVGCRGEIKN